MTPARRDDLPSLDHLLQLTDDCGVVQHATFDVPNRSTGYCVDDVARAFIVALRMGSRSLAVRMLSFLHYAQLPDGRFHNFMGYDRRWLDDVGSEDAFGRAFWALAWGRTAAADRGVRQLCAQMLAMALPHVEGLINLRPKAYAGLGLSRLVEGEAGGAAARRALARILADLAAALARHGAAGWRWFEEEMVYANARLPEVLLRGGAALGNEPAVAGGLESLAFLESLTVERGVFVPIGNHGWYRRGGVRARYAQQPIEAAAMVDAELAAFDASGRAEHLRTAGLAYDWFFGHNLNGAVLVKGGGCCDGLEEDRVNLNMGAESTLSYLMAAISIATHGVREERGVHR